MKSLLFIFGALHFSLVLFSSTIKGEDNVTTAITANFDEDSAENNEKLEVQLSEDEIILKRWRNFEERFRNRASNIVKSALRSILRVSEGINISSKCANSIMKMISGLKELKLWAYQMVDSSGKIPNGILNGHLSSLGDFDECLSVNVPGSNPFRGQYCTVFMRPSLPKRKPFTNTDHVLPVFVNFTKKGTLVDYMVREVQHFYQVALRTSICVPSTCSIEEIRTVVDIIASSAFTGNISIPTCDVFEPLVFSKSEVAIICVLSMIGLLAFIATITDVVLYIVSKERRLKVEESSTAVKCLMCFSTYTNTLRLLKKDSSPDSIKVFHGMKVITLLWVMLNHTYYFENFNMSGNLKNVRESGKQIAFQMIVNGFLNVETFFFISAVLVAYGRMKFTGKSISIPLYIFRRLWRLTPPLMLVIASSMLVPHMGSGPGWKETVGHLIDRCKANWWTNLLYINNFIKTRNTCFEWLWYIPVDTHLYIMALLVIVPLKSRPRLALGINAMLFIAGTIATAAGHIYYRHHPTAIYVFTHPEDVHYFTDNSYYRSYTHITTCCIGLYVGYFLATKQQLKIPLIPNICGWFGSIILGLVVLYGAYDWNQGNVPGLAVSTLYICTSKVAWALALSYVTIACCTGNGGVVTSILGWSAFVPLGRLTYVAYLIHPIFLFMHIGSARVPTQLNHKTKVYRFLATVFIGYGFAYVISLLFESPFMCLEKVMFSRRVAPKPPVKSNQEANFGNQMRWTEGAVATINIKKIENELA